MLIMMTDLIFKIIAKSVQSGGNLNGSNWFEQPSK